MAHLIPLSDLKPREPKPDWLKVRAPGSPSYLRLKGLMKDLNLHTVCEEARCPNIGECWDQGTATFMILGDVCTRACAYCAVEHGRPAPLDLEEPVRVAQAIRTLVNVAGAKDGIQASVDIVDPSTTSGDGVLYNVSTQVTSVIGTGMVGVFGVELFGGNATAPLAHNIAGSWAATAPTGA